MKNTKSYIILALLFFAFTAKVHSQETKRIKDFTFGGYLGASGLEVSPVNAGSNPDFMSYLYDAEYILDFMHIGLHSKAVLHNGLTAELKLYADDDFIPRNFMLDLGYSAQSGWGWGVKWQTYTWLMNIDNREFYYNLHSDMYYMGYDSDYRQITLYDHNLLTGPTYTFESGFFQATAQIMAGYGKFSSFEDEIRGKKAFSNYMNKFHFDVKPQYALLLAPSLQIKARLFTFENTSFGLIMNYNALLGTRKMDYTLSQYQWTEDSPRISQIKGSPRDFSRHCFDMGFYYRWK